MVAGISPTFSTAYLRLLQGQLFKIECLLFSFEPGLITSISGVFADPLDEFTQAVARAVLHYWYFHMGLRIM